MARLVDISPALSPRLAAWPGDVPFARALRLSLDSAEGVEVSALSMSSHAGAHVDAPSHVIAGAPTVDELSLDAFYGPCQVVAVDLPPGARIRPEDLPGPLEAPRVLLRTGSAPDEGSFRTDFCSISPELVRHLAASACVLVGIDTPSVDCFDAFPLASHIALAEAGISSLEGLRLAHVPPGIYTLIALPLRVEGGEGSPVRAALVERPSGPGS